MASELPWFKFSPSKWENGNIQALSREDKGLFIDLCAIYWRRRGEVSLNLALRKVCDGNATALDSLCDERIIEIIDGFIFIKFLSEQLNEFAETSKKNAKNAKEGWEKRRKQRDLSDSNATPSISHCEIDGNKEEEKEEEEVINSTIVELIPVEKPKKPRKPRTPKVVQGADIDFDLLREYYNKHCGNLPKIDKIEGDRKNSVIKFIKEYGKERLKELIITTKESDYLQSGSFSCGFDWIFKPKNTIKIFEGTYKNRTNGNGNIKQTINNQRVNPKDRIDQLVIEEARRLNLSLDGTGLEHLEKGDLFEG